MSCPFVNILAVFLDTFPLFASFSAFFLLLLNDSVLSLLISWHICQGVMKIFSFRVFWLHFFVTMQGPLKASGCVPKKMLYNQQICSNYIFCWSHVLLCINTRSLVYLTLEQIYLQKVDRDTVSFLYLEYTFLYWVKYLIHFFCNEIEWHRLSTATMNSEVHSGLVKIINKSQELF